MMDYELVKDGKVTGYMLKRTTGKVKRWKKRYFELHGGHLRWFSVSDILALHVPLSVLLAGQAEGDLKLFEGRRYQGDFKSRFQGRC
jgi:hypothetical protein